jgi:hypothetical protein
VKDLAGYGFNPDVYRSRFGLPPPSPEDRIIDPQGTILVRVEIQDRFKQSGGILDDLLMAKDFLDHEIGQGGYEIIVHVVASCLMYGSEL